jgi:uncharacterized protein
MRQNWGRLLFIHWPIPVELLRPMIPAQLSIDTFDGSAWIGVVPFTMWGIRASFLPAIPGTSAFNELNVRTYVHLNGVPGVWFFSLDAANRLAVWGARTFYHLPYFKAEMDLVREGKAIQYSSSRSDALTYNEFFDGERKGFPSELNSDSIESLPRARLHASWTVGEPLPTADSDSLRFFLTERYCLYSFHHQRLYRSRIFHEPWPLRAAQLNSCTSTMIESLGLPSPKGEPVLAYAEAISVDIWPLKRV